MLSKRRPSRSSRHLNLKGQSRKLISTKSSDFIPQLPQTLNPYGFRKNILKAKKVQKKEQIVQQAVFVTNKQLLVILQKFQFRQGVIISDSKIIQQKKPIILSYIQQFSQHYSTVLRDLTPSNTKLRWILICKAVNSLQLQNQFNRRYQHFDFVILPSVYAAANSINFQQSSCHLSVSFGWFREIINFQAFQNKNPNIFEESLGQISTYQPIQKQLWLINEKDIDLLPKDTNFYYYFLDEFSLQQATLKIIPSNAKTVYLFLVNNNKMNQFLAKIEDLITNQNLKQNLLKANNVKYYQKLAQSYLLNQQIYCLIAFPSYLVQEYTQKVDLLITTKQKLQLQNVKINSIFYEQGAEQHFLNVKFDRTAEEEVQIHRTLKECQDKRRLIAIYQQFKIQLCDFTLLVFHYIGNEKLHKQLQYLLGQKIEIVQEIQSFFKRKELLIIIGKFSKIQKDSLENVPTISLINLKQVQSDTYSKHSKIISQLPRIINKQDKKQSLFQFEGQNSYIKRQIYSDINQHNKWDTFGAFDEHMRCHSTPNLRQLHNQVYILVPKTVPWHSLLNRSVNPYNLLLYSNLEEVRQFTNYLDKNSFAAVIAVGNQKPSILQNIHRENFDLLQLQEMSQKNVRDCIDKIIEKECLALKKGSISKYKKGMPAILLFDQSSMDQVKFVSLMNKIFKQSKVITMNKLQFKTLGVKFKLCELSIYEMGRLEFTNSIKITSPLSLFNVYMSPIHSSLDFTSQHLHFSNKMFWITFCKQKLKKDRIRGRLNDVNMNKVHSPRSKSLKNIQFYSHEKGIAIMHNEVSLDKISKTKRFSNRRELISLLFGQLNKGYHTLVVLNEKEYKQIQQLCLLKPQGILWIVIVKNQNYCIIRQQTIVFCLIQQLQNVIISITQKFRTIKNKQFKQPSIFSHQSKNNFGVNEVQVVLYQKWSEYKKIRQNNDNSEVINIVNDPNLSQISVKQLRNALVYSKNVDTSFLLGKRSQLQNRIFQSSNQTIKQIIFILLHSHNCQFISQCLKILKEEENCVLVSFQTLEHVLLYAQLNKTIVIMQQNENISLGVCLHLAQKDTPFSFSSRLAAFIQSVRKST